MKRETIRSIKNEYKALLKEIRGNIKALSKDNEYEQIKELYGAINTIEKLRKIEYELYSELSEKDKKYFEIEREKLEIQRIKSDITTEEFESDNFLEALDPSKTCVQWTETGEDD